jgi:hypothetical protein
MMFTLQEEVEARKTAEDDGRQQTDRATLALRILAEHLQSVLEDIGNTKVGYNMALTYP